MSVITEKLQKAGWSITRNKRNHMTARLDGRKFRCGHIEIALRDDEQLVNWLIGKRMEAVMMAKTFVVLEDELNEAEGVRRHLYPALQENLRNTYADKSGRNDR